MTDRSKLTLEIRILENKRFEEKKKIALIREQMEDLKIQLYKSKQEETQLMDRLQILRFNLRNKIY